SDLRLTQADAIADATASKPGKRINNALDMVASIPFIPENYKKLVVDSVKTMPLNRMVHASKGIFSDNMADGVVTLLNGGTVVDMAKLMALGLPATAKAIVVPFLQKKATPKPKKKKGI
ncbi:MAG: hypothetical protein Q4F20_05470, partial [Eubacteriales bacterium]|nr:hypothetical protein [Eubacteriales bacterium]